MAVRENGANDDGILEHDFRLYWGKKTNSINWHTTSPQNYTFQSKKKKMTTYDEVLCTTISA